VLTHTWRRREVAGGIVDKGRDTETGQPGLRGQR
jgi:hypothetical protein